MSNLPSRIGNYTLDRRIGKGGSSEVWLARHQSLENRPVAIKLLLSQDQEWIERFTQEAAITSRLRHDNIIQILDHGTQGPHHYTVMEYVNGGSLRDAFRLTKKLSLDQAVHIFRCAGAALDFAHTSGVIHRDVSPGNILMESAAKRVLLTDFGIARQAGKAGITTVSAVMGTPGYLSPEHAASATAVTHLSDIYSLGVVLFEMLSGRLPWDHTPGMADGGGGPFTAPKTLADVGVANLPPGVDRVIQTMMAVDPTKRYPSVQLALEDLDAVLNRHTATTQVISPTDKPTSAQGIIAIRPTIPVTQPVELHPVETVLGPDLLKGPIQEARKHADSLSNPQELAELLNTWSEHGRMRRKLLGRQAAMHRITHTNIYFYTLRVLYETRLPPKSTAEPDRKAAQFPLEKELGRWDMTLPAPKSFGNDGGSVVVPGSVRVVNCGVCSGVARVPCQRCKGKGRITIVREAPVASAAAAPKADAAKPAGAGGAATATAAPAKTETIIPCPDCTGTGGVKCAACDGVGRMIEQKTVAWSRRTLDLNSHDDLPNVDETWLAKTCTPIEVYHEKQIGGFRGAWKSLPAVAGLIKEAEKGVVEDTTKIAMTELVVSFIPMAELVFDLGEMQKAAEAPVPKGKEGVTAAQQQIVNTYSLHIYGFQRNIPNDWRFLNWDRVYMWVAIGLAVAVLLLLVVMLVTR